MFPTVARIFYSNSFPNLILMRWNANFYESIILLSILSVNLHILPFAGRKREIFTFLPRVEPNASKCSKLPWNGKLNSNVTILQFYNFTVFRGRAHSHILSLCFKILYLLPLHSDDNDQNAS